MSSWMRDVKRGTQLNEAQKKYIEYLTTPRDANVGSRGPRPDAKPVYVTPFGFDIETDELVEVSNSVQGYTLLIGSINAVAGADVIDAIGAKTVVIRSGFSPARIRWERSNTKTIVAKRSKFTGQLYGSYANVDRDTLAFGKGTADADMHDVFLQLRAAVRAQNSGLALNRVSLVRERLRY